MCLHLLLVWRTLLSLWELCFLNLKNKKLTLYMYKNYRSSNVIIKLCIWQSVCLVWFMVFNATLNNISVILWWSVLLVEETRVPRENHWPAASHWQTLSHNVISSTPRLNGIIIKLCTWLIDNQLTLNSILIVDILVAKFQKNLMYSMTNNQLRTAL